MARDTTRRHEGPTDSQNHLPALALSGALALAGRAIQTSRDLGWLPNAVTIPATAVKGQDATG